ncbi:MULTISPECIES: lysozyme family protein [unclassified Enterococcus]|jgi:hypothetical protein|uniref:lysozyme family protein n=1 Tax=unclassified Enterococcus TaxID=2608891 RepID=UPI003D274AA4
MKKVIFLIFRLVAWLIAFAVITAALVWLTRTYQAVKKINTYQAEITEAVEKYDMEEYEDLVKAVILTESKGEGTDLMQSSESAYGEPNVIDTPAKSIDQGVSYLKKVIQETEKQGCNFWTAVQAYNFGVDYIQYVKNNGGTNSVELAETYSREVLSPLLGNENQSQVRYWKLQSLFYNGGYLYHNGGNMFYADIVKMNQWIIQRTTWIS